MTQTVLHIDSSARTENSVSRDLSARIVSRLEPNSVIRRDLRQALPQVTADWIGANFTPSDQRDPVQRDTLALSDQLVEELRAADTIVIGAPIYNFGVPAALKAWIDLVARAGETFRYTESGPQGLLSGKRAVIAIASGGTEAGSEIDFATGYLRHVLGFLGIHDVEIIAADRMMVSPDAALQSAAAAVEKLVA